MTPLFLINGLFNQIMTSGEALWHDIDQGKIAQSKFFAIERAQGDALAWAEGLRIELTELHNAQAVLLMGLPDAAKLADWQPVLIKPSPQICRFIVRTQINIPRAKMVW